jgi:hypothetical protein
MSGTAEHGHSGLMTLTCDECQDSNQARDAHRCQPAQRTTVPHGGPPSGPCRREAIIGEGIDLAGAVSKSYDTQAVQVTVRHPKRTLAGIDNVGRRQPPTSFVIGQAAVRAEADHSHQRALRKARTACAAA